MAAAATRLLLLVCLVAGPLPGSAARAAGPDATIAAELVAIVNAARAREGLLPVKLDTRLMQAAQGLADDLAERGTVSHADRRGGRPPERFAQVGYRYAVAEEAVAGGETNCAEVVADWLASPHHRAILLAAEVRDAGVGHAFRSDDPHRMHHYWVIDLGLAAAPAPRP